MRVETTCAGLAPFRNPGRYQVGGLRGRARGLEQVMVGLDELEPLVGRADGVEQSSRVALVDAGIRRRMYDQRRCGYSLQVRRGRALGRAQAPHRQPAAQRAQRPDAEDAVVGLDRLAQVTPRRPAAGRRDVLIYAEQVSPG